MKFQFVGDKEAPETTTIFGHKFRLKGPYVEVTDPSVIQKLQGNKCFKGKEETKAVKKPKTKVGG